MRISDCLGCYDSYSLRFDCDLAGPGKGVQKPNQNRNVEAKNRESNRTVIIAINREFDSSFHHYLDRRRPQRIHFFDLDLISFFAKGKLLFVAFLSIVPTSPHLLYHPFSSALPVRNGLRLRGLLKV